ncbi:MAG: 50S ribosomal protein L5 [Candidatus Lokiarchaeota archaeon]|nr:50S ribosomal protein L5 [Candidatus Lokiarchaeota archaeon]
MSSLTTEEKERLFNDWKEYPMRKPRIAKVVVNMGVGRSGEILVRARTVLESLTSQTPIDLTAKQTIRDFGIRKNEPIACKVTLRDRKARIFLEKAITAVDNQIVRSSFDKFGNFSFGIKEHIDIPGTQYDPDLGIFGMDVCVSFERPGYRIARRRRQRCSVPTRHKLTKTEVRLFIEKEFDVEIVEERRIKFF